MSHAATSYTAHAVAPSLGLNLPTIPTSTERARAARYATRDVSPIFVPARRPQHHDTFELKPNAPAEFRGEFNTIETNVNGIQVGEHLPRPSRQ